MHLAEQRRAERTKVEADRAGSGEHIRWPKAVHDAMTAAGLTSDDAHDLKKPDLVAFARRLGIRGCSRMNKDALVRALRAAR